MAQHVILSVEDNEANRRIVRDLFTRKGYRVIEAVDGEEGVAMARREKPDLILMDLQLPKVDGFEATRRIKADPELSHIPIVAVTSYALSGVEEKALEAGCEDYVAKPFRPRELLAKAQQLLGKEVS